MADADDVPEDWRDRLLLDSVRAAENALGPLVQQVRQARDLESKLEGLARLGFAVAAMENTLDELHRRRRFRRAGSPQ